MKLFLMKFLFALIEKPWHGYIHPLSVDQTGIITACTALRSYVVKFC